MKLAFSYEINIQTHNYIHLVALNPEKNQNLCLLEAGGTVGDTVGVEASVLYTCLSIIRFRFNQNASGNS